MSEPVPLLHCARGPVASQTQRWKELKVDISSPCNTTKPDLKQNGQCECSQSSDMTPGTGWDMDKSSCNHLPASVNASENGSLDLLRIVKHKPSTIVFSDNDCNTDNQDISDAGESSSSITEGEGGENDDEEDDFPEKSQYKEFLVSRRRRNLSRNRKYLRKRQDAQPNSAASGWQKPTNKGKPEFAGSQKEEETPPNNGKQVAACESMTMLMKKLDHLNEPKANEEGQSVDSSHSDVANADEEQQSTMGDQAVGRRASRVPSQDQGTSRASDKPEPLTRRRSQPLTRSRPLTRSSLSSPTHLNARRARVSETVLLWVCICLD
ncbi:hypothetical protein EPR50_G00138490 [Perca flavescens]|uniref:Uncharacterized protein n=1 Tax=Perca flavescens TaxID=8167 RepID=A0A484CMW1_PERFV|nr:hypothetical protein EPR50_G00138490 [Perca flavescens]